MMFSFCATTIAANQLRISIFCGFGGAPFPSKTRNPQLGSLSTNVRVCSQKSRRHRSVSPTNPPWTSIGYNVTLFGSVGKHFNLPPGRVSSKLGKNSIGLLSQTMPQFPELTKLGYLHIDSRDFIAASRHIYGSSRHFIVASRHIHARSRDISVASRRSHISSRDFTGASRHFHTHSRDLTESPRHIHTGSGDLTAALRRLHWTLRHLHAGSQLLPCGVRRLIASCNDIFVFRQL